MQTRSGIRSLRAACLAATVLGPPLAAHAADQLPDGKFITPLAIPGATQQFLNPGLPNYPDFVAGQALREELSPDGNTLAILCAGQNSLDDQTGATDTAASTQFLFLYDVSGAHKAQPVLKQAIQQPNAHVGLVWAPDGSALYAAGGNDDAVYVYSPKGGVWALARTIPLGHGATHGPAGLGPQVEPNAAGLAISADGATLVVANNYNDSISVVDTASGSVRYEHDLRPYFANNEGASGVPGGEYPFGVVLKGTIAYVSSPRDREVVVVDISSMTAGRLVQRIKLDGNALGMTLGSGGARLFVAQDNADQVAVIDTASNRIIARIDTRAPGGQVRAGLYTGAAPLSVRLDPRGRLLYAVNAGSNSIAVINATTGQFLGLLPTGYEPTDVAFSADGAYIYIINGKSITGPNPQHLYGNTGRLTTVTYPGGNQAAQAAANANNQYQFQLERSSLVSAPVSGYARSLPSLSAQVAQNNGYNDHTSDYDRRVMGFLSKHIKHVIYIVKENRTFDQVLGDLGNGANGDASLAVFGAGITPNQHAISSGFVTLDNFYDPGDGSMDGWSWVTRGRITNTEAITQQINYAFVDRGLSYESEGSNRNVPVGLASVEARDAATEGQYSQAVSNLPGGAANLLPGTADHSATDAPFGREMGYIFDAVLNAGLTVRNYGFLVSNIGAIVDSNKTPIADPFTAGVQQVAPLNPRLLDKTDTYFRGYDQNYPDLWRFNEWKREFDQFAANGNLPNLSLVRFSHDHTGAFATALAGVNTPETQQADNDLAVGKLVEAVAASRYANDTVIMAIEDDAQDGPDHVDSHRSTAYVAGAYVKKNAVVSTRYSQVNMLRTLEDMFGTLHINLNTAFQRPMSDAFDIGDGNAQWSFTSTASTILKTTTLFAGQPQDSTRYATGPDLRPAHDAAYWDAMTRGFDFSVEDRVPFDLYNHVLWAGLKGGTPYPKFTTATLAGVPLPGGN